MAPEIKTNFYNGRVYETGTKFGLDKAVQYTTEVKTYEPKREIPPAEIGFWTGLFFIIIFLLYFFRGR